MTRRNYIAYYVLFDHRGRFVDAFSKRRDAIAYAKTLLYPGICYKRIVGRTTARFEFLFG